MYETITGIILVLIGVIIILLRNKFAKKAANYYQYRERFNEDFYRNAAIIMGIIWIIVGILTIFHLGHTNGVGSDPPELGHTPFVKFDLRMTGVNDTILASKGGQRKWQRPAGRFLPD